MISDNGRVLRLDTDTVLRPYVINGHPRVVLDGKTRYIGRLVAEAFVPNNGGFSDVRHINGDKMDCRAENLEWTTHSVTQQDSFGLGINAPGGNMPPRPVRDVITGKEYPSIRSASRDTGVSPAYIRLQISGGMSERVKEDHIFEKI